MILCPECGSVPSPDPKIRQTFLSCRCGRVNVLDVAKGCTWDVKRRLRWTRGGRGGSWWSVFLRAFFPRRSLPCQLAEKDMFLMWDREEHAWIDMKGDVRSLMDEDEVRSVVES